MYGMKTSTATTDKHHLGHKLQMVREISCMKQSTLARATGLSQQYISKLEQSAYIPEDVLNKLALAMEVKPDTIRNFDKEKALYYQNEYSVNDNGVNQQNNSQIFNYHEPIHIVRELLEKLLTGEKGKDENPGQDQ